MRTIGEQLGARIRSLIDFFYPLFSKYMKITFYRYGVTGALNLVFDWVMYYLIYTYVLQHHHLYFGFFTLSSHVATLALKFPIVLATGFFMQKYVTFSGSELRGRVQLFRYFVVVSINMAFNIIGIKVCVDLLHFYPTPSNMIISILSIAISYFSQKHYTFKLSSNSSVNK